MEISFSDDSTFYIVRSSEAELTNWAWRYGPESNRVVRFVRGNKCQTVPELFNEFSAALQFPYYFGENWNAFNDCMTDLAWLEAESVVIVILNSTKLLAEQGSALSSLFPILSSARSQRTVSVQNVPDAQIDLPLYVVLQTSTDEEARFVEKRLAVGEIQDKS
jgi:RNAse (barnase) inhibitor barstar